MVTFNMEICHPFMGGFGWYNNAIHFQRHIYETERWHTQSSVLKSRRIWKEDVDNPVSQWKHRCPLTAIVYSCKTPTHNNAAQLRDEFTIQATWPDDFKDQESRCQDYSVQVNPDPPASFCGTQKKPEECAPAPGIPVLTSPFVAEQPTGRRSLFTIDIGRHRKVSLLHTLSLVTKLLTHNGGSIHRDIWYQAHICPGGRHTRDKFPQVFLPESFAFHGCSYSSLSLGRQLTNCGKLLNFPSNFGWAVSSAY